MPMTITEFVALADRLLEEQKPFDGAGAIATLWCDGIRTMKAYVVEAGWPSRGEGDRMSLMPAIHRTAIYDDIDWWDRSADWGHLEGYIAFDMAFHNQGRRRDELTDEAFDHWLEVSNSVGRGSGGKC